VFDVELVEVCVSVGNCDIVAEFVLVVEIDAVTRCDVDRLGVVNWDRLKEFDGRCVCVRVVDIDCDCERDDDVVVDIDDD